MNWRVSARKFVSHADVSRLAAVPELQKMEVVIHELFKSPKPVTRCRGYHDATGLASTFRWILHS